MNFYVLVDLERAPTEAQLWFN